MKILLKLIVSNILLLFFKKELREWKEGSGDWNVLWSGGPIDDSVYKGLRKNQKLNHFPKNIEITRKESVNLKFFWNRKLNLEKK